MEVCEWCGLENSDKMTMVIKDVGRYDVCNICMSAYVNEDWNLLDKRMGKA